MSQSPIALGLALCEMAIVDNVSGSATLVAEFDGLIVLGFPVMPQFAVFARLGDGEGKVELELVIECLETNEEIYRKVQIRTFSSRLSQVRYIQRVKDCVIERPGTYDVVLLAAGHWIASRTFRVNASRES